MAYFIDVPSLDGAKRLFLNVERICEIKPYGSNSGKSTVTFGSEHSIGVGCGPAVLVDAIRDKESKVI